MLTIRIYGGFNLVYGLASLLLFVGNRYAASRGGHNLQSLATPAACLIVIGVCLLAYRGWSVIVAVCAGTVVVSQGILAGHSIVALIYGSTVAAAACYLLFQHERTNTTIANEGHP